MIPTAATIKMVIVISVHLFGVIMVRLFLVNHCPFASSRCMTLFSACVTDETVKWNRCLTSLSLLPLFSYVSPAGGIAFFRPSWLIQYAFLWYLFTFKRVDVCAFRVPLTNTFKQTAGRSTGWCPDKSSPYMMPFVIRLPFIRCMWPSHRSQRWQMWRFIRQQSSWSSTKCL